MRGRQFGFLALLAGFWCAGRILTAQSVPAPQQAPKPKTVAAQSPSTTTPQQLNRATPTPSPERIARSAGHRLPVTPISALSPISAHIIPPSTALVRAQATSPSQRPPTTLRTDRAIQRCTGRAATRAPFLRLQLFPQGIRFRPDRSRSAIWRQPERICCDMGHCSAAPRPRHVPHRPFGSRRDCAWQNARP